MFPSLSRAQVPVFEVTLVESWIKFDVKSSVTIAGKFDKWDASLTFTSPDETTGTLLIKIQPNSVDTGSGMKKDQRKDGLQSQRLWDEQGHSVHQDRRPC
jgi:polyisoprenoid-binding protein YceI